MSRIAILGGGSWGTGIAVVLSNSRRKHEIRLWVRDPELAQSIESSRENKKYLPGITIPACVQPSSDLVHVSRAAQILVGVVPSAHLRSVLVQALPALGGDWTLVLSIVAILTMTLGNVVAVLQSNVKRMLAYSAIAHAGYILVGVVANSAHGYGAVLFYLVIYTVMNLGAFSIVLSLSQRGDQRVALDDYTGLGHRAPLVAAALSVFLISLAGIPLTGGFIGKFYLFSAAIQKGYVGLAIIGVLNSALSVFYYFRLMVIMYMREPVEAGGETEAISLPVSAVIAIGVLGTFWLGLYPAQILNLAYLSSLALK